MPIRKRWARGAAAGSVSALAALALLSCGGDDPASPANPNAPTLAVVDGLAAAEEETRVVGVSATDPDGDALALTVTGLPGFASFVDHGDGNGSITLRPLLGDAGSYPGVTIKADDGELADSITVTLSVTPLARMDGALFYEPPAFCVGGAGDRDSLFVYNPASAPLRWRAVKIPEGMTGLEDLVTLDPQSVGGVEWVWSPSGPYPVADTLVLATNNTARPLIRIPFRREDPAGAVDVRPPSAPVLFLPADGAVFTATPSVTIDVAWSELDDCSGIDYYKLEIAPTPQFTNILCCREAIAASVTQVVAEEGDVGLVYWRVYAVDHAGLKGPYSEVRSWTVVRP